MEIRNCIICGNYITRTITPDEDTLCIDCKRIKNTCYSLNELAVHFHGLSFDAGWWHSAESFKISADGARTCTDMNLLGTKIALIHSETSEMLEGLRKDAPDDHLPDRPMEEVEAADILIRLFDYAGARGLDLTGAVFEKMKYNMQRPDHKREVRAAAGGKKF